MKLIALFLLCMSSLFLSLEAKESPPFLESSYQKILLKRVGESLPELADYPLFRFPNEGSESLLEHFPQSKVLLFGYGSLINKQSAARNVKPQALNTMRPVIAFGAKRIFNYQAQKTDHWGSDQHRKEHAMLNLIPSWDINSVVNGVVMEIDSEDLENLVKREKGYDLVPILIASWEDVSAKKPNVEIKVAYTFIAPNEPRNRIIYTSTQYYPVRGYLNAVREGTSGYGQDFADFWNDTTYLADGVTSIRCWDQATFEGILCSKQAVGSSS